MVSVLCKVCGKKCRLGKDAVCGDPDGETAICDECGGIVRTRDGYALSPYEQEHGTITQNVVSGEIRFHGPLGRKNRGLFRRKK